MTTNDRLKELNERYEQERAEILNGIAQDAAQEYRRMRESHDAHLVLVKVPKLTGRQKELIKFLASKPQGDNFYEKRMELFPEYGSGIYCQELMDLVEMVDSEWMSDIWCLTTLGRAVLEQIVMESDT